VGSHGGGARRFGATSWCAHHSSLDYRHVWTVGVTRRSQDWGTPLRVPLEHCLWSLSGFLVGLRPRAPTRPTTVCRASYAAVRAYEATREALARRDPTTSGSGGEDTQARAEGNLPVRRSDRFAGDLVRTRPRLTVTPCLVISDPRQYYFLGHGSCVSLIALPFLA